MWLLVGVYFTTTLNDLDNYSSFRPNFLLYGQYSLFGKI